METIITETCSVFLHGGWTVDRAGEQQNYLLDELRGMMESRALPVRAEVDFSEVDDVDACGCQLLALFLHDLARRGIDAVPCRIPRQVTDKINRLGFGALLGSELPSSKERP